jgi:hypothetical protein
MGVLVNQGSINLKGARYKYIRLYRSIKPLYVSNLADACYGKVNKMKIEAAYLFILQSIINLKTLTGITSTKINLYL